jgi:hypothetical protein
MAADYIGVNRTKQLGNKLVLAADSFRQLRELIDQLADAKDHSFAAADFSLFETNFGLTAGTGANAATLLGYMQEIFNTNTTVAGQTRLDRIEEFCARLAGQ